MDFAFGVVFKSSLPSPRLITFAPVFSSRGVVVLHFTFDAVICFELIFEQGVRLGQGSAFCIGTPTVATPFIEKTILSP